MSALTSRQRLLRLFSGKPIDRVPVWLLAPFHPLTYYADIYNNPAYKPLLPKIEAHCDTFDRRRPDLGFCYNGHPSIQPVPFSVGGADGYRVNLNGTVLEKSRKSLNGKTRMEFYVRDPGQLELLCRMPFEPVRPDLQQYRIEQLELGDRGLFMLDLGDPLEVLYHLASAQDFSMWTITDYDKLTEFLDIMYRRAYELYRYFLENDVGDIFFIVGAEFAGPPIVSPQRFNELSVKYVKGIVDLIRSYGKFSIVHYHGSIARVLDGFVQMAPNGIHTIEAPPMGDCTIAQARKALGSDTVLIGNIQYDDLVHKSPEEIDFMVKNVIDEAEGSPFILSPTAGPYEQFPTERTIKNYLAFIDAGARHGSLT